MPKNCGNSELQLQRTLLRSVKLDNFLHQIYSFREPNDAKYWELAAESIRETRLLRCELLKESSVYTRYDAGVKSRIS